MKVDIPSPGARLPRPSGQSLLAPPAKLRLGLCILGAILGISGAWLLAPELLRPKAAGIPQDGGRAGAAAAGQTSAQSSALWAARIAGIRGDLWAEAALADSALWLDRSAILDRANAGRIEKARSSLEKALAFAPINGQAWLILAALPASPTSPAGRAANLLEMSYFTAPNDLRLADLRLERAAATAALANKDIQEFAKGDIRRILTYRPQAKSAIVTAYRNALPQNRPIVEALVGDVDPAFAQALRAGATR